MTHDELSTAIDRYQQRHGVEQATATRAVLALATLAMAQHMPSDFIPGMLAAAERALTRSGATPLEPVRVAAWKHLKAKHGTSIIVADKEDQALRLLIAIAWDEDLPADEVDLALEYFLPIINDQAGLGTLLVVDS